MENKGNCMTVEIINIIDRSGSMNAIKADAIGSLNSFIEQQQAEPGEANITTVLFDDQYEILEYRQPLVNATKFDDKNFVPRNSTALNDAIGRTIAEFRRLHDENKLNATGVIMCILTDGVENASKEYTKDNVKSLITEMETKYDWRFIYLAANQDAFQEGNKYGFASVNTSGYEANARGLAAASTFMSNSVSTYRSSRPKVVLPNGLEASDSEAISNMLKSVLDKGTK